MANCAKCGAELIGSGRFCASCGAPAAASPSSSQATDREIGSATPLSSPALSKAGEAHDADAPIDPLAATASPASVAKVSVPLPSPVSPLAKSNIERETFEQIVGAAAKEIEQRPPSAAPPPPAARPKKAGTQLMPNAPAWWRLEPGEAARLPASEAPPPPKKAPPRTVAMRHAPNPAAAPAPQSAPVAPQSAARSLPTPQAPYPAPVGAYPAQPPAAPAGWGSRAPAAPPPYPYPAPFGYAPGARVQVTWSNGQRYPATVSQVSGSQCLVVFPDGQQHWVDAQYLSPA